ncbi:hypothetical protein BMF94_2239 [Rhodotorula taiwanensis]|uniref:t-SNARE coiled-coil homology domain-containing protein n=1 Tax=Rhodotorula taiwanensis TaxID=741276 RepID=A0A2S5BDD4_9BASI|nr:hypothetical protein BMF94_2239 [Rhodotorula taiwanensis]
MAPPTQPGAVTGSRLSHLSTTTLSSVLELTRLHQLDVAAPAHLGQSIQRNLTQLARGITTLEDAGTESDEVVGGLRGQWERIAGLVEPLGIEPEARLRPLRSADRTGRLVETDDEDAQGDLLTGEDGTPLQDVGAKAPHISISVHDDRKDLAQMEEDEEEMERANQEVLQMQQRMLEDQDTQLNSLSSAISRQHALSLRVAEELELHSSLLDDTDEALDRTGSNLRRASGRLDEFTRRARNTGSTGLIIALIILLVILIVIFKF